MSFGTIDDQQFQQFVKRVGNEAKTKHMLQAVGERTKVVGLTALKSAKGRTPVDTGTLRRSFSLGDVAYSGSFVSVSVDNNVEYAPFVENGHRTRGGKSWVPGRFMLKGAIEETSAKVSGIFEPAVQKYLEALFND